MTTLSQDFSVLIETIAKKNFPSIETLERRGRDGLDFHDVSVECIKSALQEAFFAGMKFGSEIK